MGAGSILLRGKSLTTMSSLMMLIAMAAAAQVRVTDPGNGLPLSLPTVASVVDCSGLTSADISKDVGAPVRIAHAAVVSSGQSDSYCNVQVVVDEYANFELHLPLFTWTQRLLFSGGPPTHGGPAFVNQFATVSWLDLGNRGHEDRFADNYAYRVNFAYRGMHLQVLAAKALVARFYNQTPKFSYYNACSEPGREGMMEVQRFPGDFDGVAAGCPPINDPINNGLFPAWNILTNTGADGKPIITLDKLPVLHSAVLSECDAADGVKDGIISDPLSCHPSLTEVECKPGQASDSCLTSAQIHVAKEIYSGAHDAKGSKLEPIGGLPGSELFWKRNIIPDPTGLGPNESPDQARLQTALAIGSEFNDPSLPSSWKLSDLKFDRASFNAITKLHYLYDATDPDLTSFAKAGHKLILWQALEDVNVLPAHAVLYYTALQKTMGAETVHQFVRFYLLPGVGHCGGGDGPFIRDFLTPLMLWVERGIAPGAIEASHVPQGPGGPFAPPVAGSKPDLTRPIYPYPYTAQYIGTGSIADASNYVQGPAHPAPPSLFNWLGASFYTPHYEKWCTANGATFNCKDSR